MTTKVWVDELAPDRVRASCEASPNVAAVPKSASPERRRESFDLAFTLTGEDRARIAALPKDRRIVDLDFAPDWDPPAPPDPPA